MVAPALLCLEILIFARCRALVVICFRITFPCRGNDHNNLKSTNHFRGKWCYGEWHGSMTTSGKREYMQSENRMTTNRRRSSIPLPSEMELLGDGKAFQDFICAMLKKAKGFENFEQPDLIFLAKHMKAYRALEGTTIFREGDSNSYLCVLIEGRVSVYKEDSNSELKLLTVIPPGRIFGEISVIDNLPCSASLVAESDATIVLMSRESFRRCIDERSIIGVRLLSLIAHLLCARLRSASGQLVEYIDV